MQHEQRKLLIVAVSGRALARSARRSNLSVSVLDAFADRDTRALTRACSAVTLPFHAQEILAGVQRIYSDNELFSVIYGSGMEHAPEIIEALEARTQVHGNRSEVLRVIGHARRWFSFLNDLAIPYPEVAFVSTTDRRKWLVKYEGRSGGQHVAHWSPAHALKPGQYLQRYVTGPVYSVLFVADGESFQVIGWNRLLRAKHGDAPCFAYRGALGHVLVSAKARRVMTHYISSLVSSLQLRGLNGLDFALDGDEPLVLDLNARPPATVSLYDDEFPRGLVDVHIGACDGRFKCGALTPTRRGRCGHAIIYSRCTLHIPDGLTWPPWCTDLPNAGSTIGVSEPVCTVHARGNASQEEIEHMLECRQRGVHDWLDSAAALPHRMSAP